MKENITQQPPNLSMNLSKFNIFLETIKGHVANSIDFYFLNKLEPYI